MAVNNARELRALEAKLRKAASLRTVPTIFIQVLLPHPLPFSLVFLKAHILHLFFYTFLLSHERSIRANAWERLRRHTFVNKFFTRFWLSDESHLLVLASFLLFSHLVTSTGSRTPSRDLRGFGRSCELCKTNEIFYEMKFFFSFNFNKFRH